MLRLIYDDLCIDYLATVHFVPGQVYISMGNTISEFLAEVSVGDDARALSPAANYLFNIDDEEGNSRLCIWPSAIGRI